MPIVGTIEPFERAKRFPKQTDVQEVLEGIKTAPTEEVDDFAGRTRQILRRQGADEMDGLSAKDILAKPIAGLFDKVRPKIKEAASKIFPEGKFRISQGFGNVNEALYSGITKGAKHLGLDIAAPQGTALKLPVGGNVQVGLDPRGFGAWVKVTGDDGSTLRFSHLSQINPAIARAAETGAKIAAGTVFGLSGGLPSSRGAGNTTGAHLDITARQGGKFVDPMKLESVRRALGV